MKKVYTRSQWRQGFAALTLLLFLPKYCILVIVWQRTPALVNQGNF